MSKLGSAFPASMKYQHDEVSECFGPDGVLDDDHYIMDDRMSADTQNIALHYPAGAGSVVPANELLPREILGYEQQVPTSSTALYGPADELPDAQQAQYMRVLLDAYSQALEPGIPLTHEDMTIGKLIHNRMQQLQGAAYSEGLSSRDAQYLLYTPEDVPAFPSPHANQEETLVPSGISALRCLYNGCGRTLASTATRDIGAHFQQYHSDDYATADDRGDQDEMIYCQWEHCPREVPMLKRSLTKHVKEVHLRERRIKCIHDGCPDTFSRRDAMKRHAKKCGYDPSASQDYLQVLQDA